MELEQAVSDFKQRHRLDEKTYAEKIHYLKSRLLGLQSAIKIFGPLAEDLLYVAVIEAIVDDLQNSPRVPETPEPRPQDLRNVHF